MIRLRFAPSPTGNLHIGTIRTALFNWIYAKHVGGKLILRIEDTDLARSKPEYEDNINEGLAWLRLTTDESPEHPGEFGPYRQSERMAEGIYDRYALSLIKEKRAYYCFCSNETLEAEREQAEKEGKAYVYSGTCKRLSEDDINRQLANQTPHTIRFSMPGHTLTFPDLIRGDISFDLSLISDFILVKSDKSPSYNFCCAVDDMLMRISHVIRGEDHISNTPRQIVLFDAFGYPAPQYAHLPMILGPDRSKLSKRHAATAVTDYRDMGFLSDAMFNYLSILGWTPPDKEILETEEVVSAFSLEKVSKSGAIFDVQKLKWMNGQYIRKLSPDQLYATVLPVLTTENVQKLSHFNISEMTRLFFSVKDNLETLTDINTLVSVYALSSKEYETSLATYTFSDSDKEVVSLFISLFSALETPTSDQIDTIFATILDQTKLGKGKVLKPVRLACTATGSGPHLSDYLSIMAKSEIENRLAIWQKNNLNNV